MLLVEQEIEGDNRSVLETIMEADAERTDLLKRERDLLTRTDKESANELAEVHTRLNEIDFMGAEIKARKLLTGLGFTEEM